MKKHLPHPLIVAHRGFSAACPENTLAAFQAAIDAGAHMIELDVTLSADREAVVIHDDTVDRTTNGTGAVRRLTSTQLQGLDAGSWFHPRFQAERVPTLDQVLRAVKGRIMVNIEIKPAAFEPQGPADALERQVLTLIHSNQMDDDVLISSFAWRVLANVRQRDPAIALGLLSKRPADDHLLDWYRRIDGFSWHPDGRVLTRSQVQSMHAAGARVMPYGLNRPSAAQRVLAMGVDGVFVDDPTWIAAESGDAREPVRKRWSCSRAGTTTETL